MKLNLEQVLVGIDGKPIKEQGESLTLRAAFLIALRFGPDAAKTTSASAKVKAFRLAVRIASDETAEVDLSSAQINMIREFASDAFKTEAFGSLVQVIDPRFEADE